MGRLICLTAVLTVLTGCAEFNFHLKKDSDIKRPITVLIGPFTVHDMNFDPHVSEEFRLALRYEFFKNCTGTILMPVGEDVIYPQKEIATFPDNYSADLMISGVISQRETGYLTDREIETVITFSINNRKGELIAEGFYTDNCPAGKESLRRDAAGRIVNEFLKTVR